MLNRFKNKFIDTAGVDQGVMIAGIIFNLLLLVYIIISCDNTFYEREIANFQRGLDNASAAALIEIDTDIEENTDNIAQGYIIQNNNSIAGYNHVIKLNRNNANNYALMQLSLKTGYLKEELKPYFKTVIIEPQRVSLNTFQINVYFYKNIDIPPTTNIITNVTEGNKDNKFTEIENLINSSYLKKTDPDQPQLNISLSNNFLRKMEIKPYFLAIVDGFSLSDSIYSQETDARERNELINLYSLGGGNLMRSTGMRVKQ